MQGKACAFEGIFASWDVMWEPQSSLSHVPAWIVGILSSSALSTRMSLPVSGVAGTALTVVGTENQEGLTILPAVHHVPFFTNQFGSVKRGNVCEMLWGFKKEKKQHFQLLHTSQFQLWVALPRGERNTPLWIWVPESSRSSINWCSPSVLLQNKQEWNHSA